MVSWTELALVFLKVGTLGFGGPFALLALMEKEVVQRRGWLTPEEFAQSTAIGTLTPGPIFFSAAAHVGYQLRGFAGALVAATASLLPAFLAAVAFAALYLRVQSLPAVNGAARGLTVAVVGLLALVAVRNAQSLVRNTTGAVLAVASFAALEFFRLNPVWVVVGAGLAGVLLYHPPHKAKHETTGRQEPGEG